MSPRRKTSAALEHWLTPGATPVFILDAQRRVAAFNAGCERLTGWGAAEVVGQACHYGSGTETDGVAALTSGLCPPPEVFSGEQAVAPAYLVDKQGQTLPRVLFFFPLRDERERVQGVLGIIQPLPSARPLAAAPLARLLHAELAAVRTSLRSRFGLNTIVAQGVAMRKAIAQALLAQQTSTAVLFEGEAGVGKEHLARVIHFSGLQQAQWFVPLDCRRLGPDELDRVWTRLIDTHQPQKRGGSGPQPGTVYLSDVEHLPRDLQERLVQAFAPEDSRLALKLRLMSATSCDLQDAVAKQAVRPDFFALISPLTIEVPPLRERGGDLPLLAQHFLEELNVQESKQLGGFDEAVWPLFSRYLWPGNLDELLMVIREARANAESSQIRVQDLPFRFRTALESQAIPPPLGQPSLPLDVLLTRLETRLIELALARTRNNKSQAAELLGIHRARLIRRIEQLGLGTSNDEAGPAGALEQLSAELLQDEPRPE